MDRQTHGVDVKRKGGLQSRMRRGGRYGGRIKEECQEGTRWATDGRSEKKSVSFTVARKRGGEEEEEEEEGGREGGNWLWCCLHSGKGQDITPTT